MKILLTGRNGQVGRELEHALAPLGEVIACDRSTLNLADPDQIREIVRSVRPDVIVNAGGYTAVDKAEIDEELAFAVNAKAPAILAEEAKHGGSFLVHYSTDYVFDGEKPEPYTEDDEPNPINVYGRTKLAGERAIESELRDFLIIRTSWVFGQYGSNFPKTILRLARARPILEVVDDQIGAPTSAALIASVSFDLLQRRKTTGASGLLHVTSSGHTSWYHAALAIKRAASFDAAVRPIRSSGFPTPAKRPLNSRLSLSKLRTLTDMVIPDWEAQLAMFAQEMNRQI